MPYLPPARALPIVVALLVALIAGSLASCHDASQLPEGASEPAGKDGGRERDAGRTRAGLADDHAGKACTRDGDCPGGECVSAPSEHGEVRYCSAACSTNAQCGHGGQCVARNGGERTRECLAACDRDADCREQFSCVGSAAGSLIPLIGSCWPRQATDTLADDVAGRSCSDDGECTGGRCQQLDPLGVHYPGNYCSGRCYADSDCGRGGACLALAGAIAAGHCLQSCAGEDDCTREGYRCRQLGTGERLLQACIPGRDPLPDHTAGKACSDDDACGGAATCAHVLTYLGSSEVEYPATGGYCTQECALDSDCGAGAQCVSRGPRGGLCFASCNDALPCRPGYDCLAHLRDGNPEAKVCVPSMQPDPSTPP